jgi:Methyltransferase domain
MNDQSEHWKKVYQTNSAGAVSWFQEHASRSLNIIRSIGADKSAGIIDVGGGASTLVDDLLGDGFRSVTVLDLSESALEVARSRLGAKSALASWIAGDIRSVVLPAPDSHAKTTGCLLGTSSQRRSNSIRGMWTRHGTSKANAVTSTASLTSIIKAPESSILRVLVRQTSLASASMAILRWYGRMRVMGSGLRLHV